MEHYAWTVALTRMISAVFRRGGDVSFVVEELKAVFDPRGGQWMGGRYVPSLLAAIGEVIERHMIRTASWRRAHRGQEGAGARGLARRERRGGPDGERSRGQTCPRCNSHSLHRRSGCWECDNCGYSKCD